MARIIKPDGYPGDMMISDNSIVVSQSIRPQIIGVLHRELKKYIDFIEQNSRTIGDAALLTSMLLRSSKAKEWIERASYDQELHTLGKAIEKKWSTCFHKSVFYNALMNYFGVSCAAVRGTVEDISNNRRYGPEHHCWNMIRYENGVWLIDTAFKYNHKPLVRRVYETDIDTDRNDRNTIVFAMPDGSSRTYQNRGNMKIYPM